ncbi:MAG: RsmE family RNA methyltransferase [Terriglobales bacterium]
MARRRFFASACDGARARIDGESAHHLTRVLRVQPGQEYELAWKGALYLGRIESARTGAVELTVTAQLAAPQPESALELAAAIFKFDRFEWMLEKATELGMTRLWPVVSRRSDPRLAAAAAARARRWRQIALSAAEQSRRATCPDIAAALSLAALLAHPFAGQRLLLSEAKDAPAMAGAAPPLRLLLGPEGGWSEEEASAAAAAGYRPVSLGGRILRAETAALAALALSGSALVAG